MSKYAVRMITTVAMFLGGMPGITHAVTGDPYFAPDVFNWRYYIQQNPDLQRAGILTEDAARWHWQTYGISECRQAHPGFHTYQYLNDPGNADIRATMGTCQGALSHYVNGGRYQVGLGGGARRTLIEQYSPEVANCSVPTAIYFVRQRNKDGAAEMIRYETDSPNPPATYRGGPSYVAGGPVVRYKNSTVDRWSGPSHAQNCTPPYAIGPNATPRFDYNGGVVQKVTFKLRTENFFTSSSVSAGNHLAVLLRGEFWAANRTQWVDVGLPSFRPTSFDNLALYPTGPMVAHPMGYRALGAIMHVDLKGTGPMVTEEYFSTYYDPQTVNNDGASSFPLQDGVDYTVTIVAGRYGTTYTISGTNGAYASHGWTVPSTAVGAAGTGLAFAVVCRSDNRGSCEFNDEREFGVHITNITSTITNN